MSNRSIAVCDQNQLFREGLRSLLADSIFTVISVAASLSDVLDDEDPSTLPDLIICGLDTLDEMDGDFATRHYAVKGGPKLIVLSNAATPSLLRRAAEAGVHAVLSKNISGEVLQRAIELVLLGQRLFPAPPVDPYQGSRLEVDEPIRLQRPTQPIERSSFAERSVQLSEREAQILRCLVEGAPNKRIARDLAITEATVKVHIKGLLRKLRVNNRTQAAVWGLSNPYATEPRGGAMASLAELPVPLRIAS